MPVMLRRMLQWDLRCDASDGSCLYIQKWMEELKSLNRRTFIKQSFALGAVAAFGTLPLDVLATDKQVRLTILHTNDVHSRIEPFPLDGSRHQGLGGVARRSTLINSIRKTEKNVLLLDAGDMFQGEGDLADRRAIHGLFPSCDRNSIGCRSA